MINTLELVKSFETEMGYFNAFCKNKSYLFFGCQEGILILDHSLNRVKSITIKYNIKDLALLSDQYLVIGINVAEVHIFDTKELKKILTLDYFNKYGGLLSITILNQNYSSSYLKNDIALCTFKGVRIL